MKSAKRENKILYFIYKKAKKENRDTFTLEEIVAAIPNESKYNIDRSVRSLHKKGLLDCVYADSTVHLILFLSSTEEYVEQNKSLSKKLIKIFKFFK